MFVVYKQKERHLMLFRDEALSDHKHSALAVRDGV